MGGPQGEKEGREGVWEEGRFKIFHKPMPITSTGCQDLRQQCREHAEYRGYCNYQSAFMINNCPRACGFCGKCLVHCTVHLCILNTAYAAYYFYFTARKNVWCAQRIVVNEQAAIFGMVN